MHDLSRTLPGVLLKLVQGPSARAPLYTFLGDDGEEAVWSAFELDVRARRIAAALRERGTVGERVLLLYPPGLDYIAGFFGCLYAGAVAVPAYPPDPMRLERTLPRLRAIIQDARASVVLTTAGILELSDFVFEQAPDFRALHWMATDALPEGGERDLVAPEGLGAESLAFLQYTSGSTGTPKGVMLTHGNLLHNLSLIHGAFGARADSVGVIWLPPYHDMGLIGGILEPLFGGFPVTLLSPMTFLKRPMAWLEAVSRHGGTISGGPNFAFDLCVKKSTPEERRALDLSRWEVAFCGAEPIRPETLERFVEAFGPSGFRREAFYPCYGLAEGTLIVSGGEKSAPPVSLTLSGAALERHRAEEVDAAEPGARTLVGCGRTLAEQRIAIVDPETLERRVTGAVGEVWVSGPSVAQGYWGREEATRETFQARIAGEDGGPYLRTGDLGFLRPEGELYVTGRRKDLLILRGRNHYPQDLEATVEGAHPALRPGGGAVFSVEVGGEERAVIVQEIDVRKLGDLRKKFDVAEAAVGAVRQRLAESHEVQAHAVVLIEPGSLPKTSSGKVQRHASRAAFLAGTLQEVMTWRQEEPGGVAPLPSTAASEDSLRSASTSEGPLAPAQALHPSPSSGGADESAGVPSSRAVEAATGTGVSDASPSEALPVTPSAKPDAEALVAWLRDLVARHARMRREELDVDAPVTRHGLDSLGAVELAHEVSTGTGLTVPMEWLLQGPSITSLARRLLTLRTASGPSTSTLRRRDVTGDRAASFAQARLWFLDRYAPGDVTYNLPAAVRLEGELDVSALEGCLQMLAARHDALRTSFRERDGRPLQVISPDAMLPLARVSLESVPPELREAEASRLAHEEARRPFDLARGPLVRATLLTLDARTHVLVLVMHHIVSDGTSMAVLVREVSALYASLREGRRAQLPALPLTYADYAEWQREWLDGAALAAQLDSWRTQLAAAPRLLELATDRPRPAERGTQGARVPVVLDSRLAEAVRTLAVREGVTPFMVLLAGFQAVLARRAGQDDISVGTAIAGRGRAELQRLVGLFVNTLVMRTRLSGAPTFRELLGRVRATAMGAYAHQDVPFEKLVEALQPTRECGHTPLFQVMFILQGAQVEAPVLPGLESRLVDVHPGTAMFDLTLSLAESARGFEGWLEYATDLFDADTVARIAGHLRVLLEAAVSDPSRKVDALPWLDALEAEHLLALSRGPEVEFPADATISSRFAAQVARTPDAVALVAGAHRLTYRELRARARALAHTLRQRGVGQESVVGLCVDRSVELAVGMLGILEAGAAYLPLDPAYPAQRLAAMWADSGAKVLVGPRRLEDVLAVPAEHRLFLDDVDPSVGADFVRSASDARTLAYVLYTSGSTGRPKGVGVPQRTVMNFLRAMDAHVSPSPGTWLAMTSISFDISVLELLWSWTRGFQVVLVPTGLEPAALAEALEHHAVTHFQCTPSYARALVEEPRALRALGGLRQLLVGGEALPGGLAARLRAHVPALLNMYGPTETTVWSSMHRVEADTEGTVPLGRPLANTGLHVLDAGLRPVPAGVPGELFIGGEGVVRGYLGRPDLTAARFVPDPFREVPGARLYRTGDRVRWRADGTLEFLGRVDHQVKLRGFRIEPGELEAALRTHPEVREAVVAVREEVPGEQRLVAYVAPASVEAGALREHLRSRLPEYMVPSAFVGLDALPLTPNGKVDRGALPAPVATPTVTVDAGPLTPLQEKLAALFQDVLHVERVGAHDDFFALGGHSLLATQLVTRVAARFGVDLPVRALFDAPTVARLAERIEALPSRHPADPIPTVARGGALPLSFAQQRMWFLDRLEPGQARYNISLALRLSGPLDVEVLRRAFAELVRRHEPLRTTFEERDGQPLQRIHAPPSEWSLPVEPLPAGDALRQRLREEAARPFDLGTGPLMRTRLFQVSEQEHVLLLCMHHIVSDGWSMGVLAHEVGSLYTAFSEGRPSPLPALEVQAADFAVWQRQQGETAAARAHLDALRTSLKDLPALALPAEQGLPSARTARGGSHVFTLPASLVRALEQVGRGRDATLFMVLLAGYEALLARYSGQDDFAVGSPVAHRTRPELEPLIGVFLNTLVLRARLDGAPRFTDLLDRVRESALSAYAWQDVPFERLVESLAPERGEGRASLFQVMFALHNAPVQPPALHGVRVALLPTEVDTSRFDLSLSMLARDGGLDGTLEYSRDLFTPTTAARLADHLRVLLEAVAADATVAVHRLPLMDTAERARVLVDWSTTGAAPFVQDTLPRLFEAQARRAPESVAVEHEGRTLTYGELEARANQLARHLLSLGLRPEGRVGLCLERGLELVVGMLGILKAGGCYVPLDPAYPARRLTFMCQDASLSAMVTVRPLLSVVPEPSWPTVCLDTDADALSRQDTAAPASGWPEQLAYVLYTSGSTGTPKGAGVEHRSIVHLVRDTNYVHLTPADVVAQVSTPSFDAATFEIWGALLNGARLVILPRDVTLSPPHLARKLREVGATTALLTTALFHEVAREEPGALAALRHAFFGGDRADPRAVRSVLAAGPQGRLVNLYGPTEATVCATFHAVDALPADATVLPIGRPVARARLYVLDASGEPVAPGAPGELFIGGEGVGRGYPSLPAATAERFVPDAFSGAPGARLYRTGDRARWRADGTLDFLGRVDTQVKLRGFRIEPGEIEAALHAHPSVREALVVVRDERLVAYVVGSPVAEPAVLRAFLSERLPAHLVPFAFVPLGALPLTPGGKLDRGALPAPEQAAPAPGPTVPEHLTPFQRRVAGLFRDVLRVERVGLHDDFFALGGHSLLATQLLSRLRATFQVEVPLRGLFTASTVARVTELVEEQLLLRAEAPRASGPRPVPREGALPLSFSQQRLWVLEQLQPGATPYVLIGAVRLEGALDAEALRRALALLVERHEALRTTFALKHDEPVQVIRPALEWALPVTELEARSSAARDEAVQRLALEEAGQPFDLGAGPLLRSRLLRFEPTHHVLLLAMHHIVSDGWSVGVMVREVAAAYAAFASGTAPVLPPLPLQYADFAAWQRGRLQGDVLSAEVAWWRQRLADAPRILDLPTDHPRPVVRSPRGALLPLHLPRELADRLEALARREVATPFMALLAVWHLLLSRYSRQEDLLVGAPIAGRTHGDVEGLVGFFVNTLVLRARVHPEASFRALLGQVRDTTLAAYEHQDLPFEKLVEELQVPRDLGRTPLVQAVFALQNAPAGRFEAPALGMELLEVDAGTAHFDLSLVLTETPDGLRGSIEYSTDLFERDTVARLAGHLRVLLEAAVTSPDEPVSRLPWLTPEERQEVLVAWNDTARPYPSDSTLAERFALQVARRPEAIAVEGGEERLTYSQLDARANQLAHFLRARGVGPDVPVALCMERSVEFVVTVLAIVKAGGAYVPMDAAYPAQRLALMLEDARPRMLLTTRVLRDRLQVPDAALPCIFVDALVLDDQPVTAPETGAGPRDLAYVIFTSGSSGRPKGVGIEHRGLLRTLHSAPYMDYGMHDAVLLFAPVSFDASVLELWLPLVHGGRLVVFPSHVPATDLDTLAHVVEHHGVTFGHMSSGLFSQLMEHRPDILGGLHGLHTGGDIVSAPHVRRAAESLGIPFTNGYGPSECSVVATTFTVERPEQVGASVSIGAPIANTSVYVLDARMHPVPVGVPGELFLGGDGVGRGYVSRPDLTAERFVPDALGATPGARLYRTGDMARWRPDGTLEFLGRQDTQVKVRGFRVELAEVEAALRDLPAVQDAAVVVREDVPGDKRLVAYAMPRPGHALEGPALRAALRQRLPEFMVPSVFVSLDTLPLNPSGKVDRKALPAPDAASTGRQGRFVEPTHPLEQRLAHVFARELGADRVGARDHLFEDLGATSLTVVRLATRLREELQREVPVVWLFEHPTLEGLVQRLEHESQGPGSRPPPAVAPGHRPREAPRAGASGGIAIIGMAGRFPGAMTVAEFWRNLREGVESLTRFSQEELEHLPGLPEGLELWQHPAFVPAGGVIDGVDRFDHAFFDMSLREAQFTDPQQRLFLQTAWAALEDAGVDPERFPGAISLYAGATGSGYAEAVRQAMPLDAASFMELHGTATHESLATKTSFKLGLTGESTLVYTACSTGLVAVHMACQSLRTGQSDVALAGATRLAVPQRTGYVAQEGLIFSPDGHCRAFDAKAQGTLAGNGVGAVVLKRLEDALRDGDSIYAVIRGSALNNDGWHKSGFTAPSVQGQAAVVAQALANAGVAPEAVGYVEAHGTATPLGDPIEVAALTRAYGLGPEHRGRIALASLKTNVGHLDTAAGLAGLMKAALALHHGEIPPSLHFEHPNPQIDFDAGPFFVNTTLRPWPRSETPRFAAVSSFGIGGTNAHAILEEAPMRQSGSTTRSHQLIVLSARSPEALEAAARQLDGHVTDGMDARMLADLAFTHAVGRRRFEYRHALVVKDAADLVRQLRKPVAAVKTDKRGPRVAFVFSGQGAQRVAMGRELSEASPLFRAHLERCLALLEAPLRARVSRLLSPGAGAEADAMASLAETRVALPALFSVQVSLARLWQDLGVQPYAVLGHSFGEYAAACVAGALSLEDAMRLTVARGELMHRMPPGAMLAVALPSARVQPLLSGRLELAAVNTPDRCVVSGPVEEVERLEAELKAQKAGAVRMPAPHAFHSADVEPLMPELARVVGALRWSEPKARYVSSLTGTVARPGQLAEPRYWTEQMRRPVHFTRAVETLQEEGCAVLLEVGPGQDVTPLVRANLVGGEDGAPRVRGLASLRLGGATTEQQGWLQAVGELWASGVIVDWSAFYAHEQRLRLHLPTYAFQEKTVWVEPKAQAAVSGPVLRPTPPLPPPPAIAVAAPVISPAPALPEPATPEVPVTEAPSPAQPVRDDAPRGEVEARVAALWRERLGLEFVGRHDNFLEIGGNSLTAAQLLNQVRDTFGVNLPLAALFEAPTVAGIAERLVPLLRQAPRAPVSTELPLVPLPRTGELPLSFVQERVWRLEQHLPGRSTYNLPFVLRLEGDVNAEVLERGIQEIVQRHEALRTTYDAVDGRPVQRFHAQMRVPLTRVELGGPMEAREAEALRLAREDASKAFDLVHGPVLRTTLIRLDAKVHLLLGCLHHIVGDTLSIALFVQELGQLYDAFLQGRPSPLPPLPLQYADFGAWQRNSIAGNHLPEQDQGWRQRLAGMPRRLDLPTDRPRPADSPLTSERMTLEFSPGLSRELMAFSRREGFTGYMTVLAAWQTVLHRYSGQTDIIVGTPIANRTRPELLPLIGYVAHSAAFRTRFTEGLTFRDLLVQVRDEVTDAQTRPDVPFEYLVEALIPGRDIGRGRMTDSVFVYHTGAAAGATTLELIGIRGSLVEVPDTPVQWGATLSDLTLLVSEAPGRVHGVLEYATELFDAVTVARLVEHFQVLLGAALARPETPVSHLPLATEAERRAWPAPRVPPGFTSVPALLAERRARHPDAVAISRGETHWTWTELGARADALASRLKALGVTAGTPVAVCLRSSPEKLAALWAVLAAGGAGIALGPADLGHLPVYAPEGARVPVLVTTRAMVASVRVESSQVVYVEDVDASGASRVAGEDARALAWLLPTGSGQPAWALGHRELAGFFTGLDARLSPPDGGAWLSASEAAADRPELEALWALTRGLRVVYPPERITARLVSLGGGGPRAKAMDLSLIYFANDEDTLQGPKYELLMEGARFADANGFSAVWTPERHFHSFGGLYPQPAVVSAAVAAVTKHLHLRSGSVVLPLHDPLLIAEQWSVVDNLSQGRVGLSVATGWHTQDFTFAPANFEKRRDLLLEKLSTLRALWRGERLKRPAGAGTTAEIGLRPKPVQKELPVWLTAAANPETFRMAGELGAGVLTGLLSHSLEELKPKVALYREAWRRNGHPGRGHVTCMLHTYLGDDDQEVLRQVRQPLLSYFRSSVDILTSLLLTQGYQGDIQKLSPQDIDALLEHTFENHARTTGLVGTVDGAMQRLRDVRAADVDEVAALIDFGLETPVVLDGLRRLAVVRERMAEEAAARQEQVLVEAEAGVEGLLELARQSGAALLHTSARLARTLSELPQARESLAHVGALVLEGASVELGAALHRAAGVEVWLSGDAQEGVLLPRTPRERIPADLETWVLDAAGQPVPAGVVGELALAGAGLPTALWRAGDEEHRRLVPHPRESAARLYRTGRHARMRADGRVEPVATPSRLPPPPVARPAVEAPKAAAPVVNAGPPPIPRVGRGQPLPLSFAQQRLWYLQQLEPTSGAYNNAALFRLVGALDEAALQAALDALVTRHEVLRTTYSLDGDRAVQVIHPSRGLPLQGRDVEGETPEAREAEMQRFCRAHALRPFDLEQEVLRATLLRLEPQVHVLALVFHHAVSDAWCNMVVAHELTANYAAFRAGQPSPLPPLPVQYADYAVWQRGWLEGGVMEAQVAWWKQQLLGAPALELPTDRPRPAVQSFEGARHRFAFPADVSAPLMALGRKHGATSFMVMMALFQTLLSRYSGQEDFVVGTPIAGRTRPEVEWLMGCFINTLPMRSRLSGQPSFVELLGRVRTQALEGYARQDAPFERVLETLELPRDLSRTPVFQVSLNVVNTPEARATLPSLELSPVDVPTDTAKFDLALEVLERRTELSCHLEYATALFDEATIARMAEHLVVLAREVIAAPEAPLATLSLLTPTAREQVLRGWNDTRADFPRGATLHQLFESQAERAPEAIALQFEDQRLTYAQLDARANQLAHHLRARGAGPETLVG
ncbi:non-ribosomal peptide synthase/polyketide synthase, partial [Corallococcus sp. RDP092CA]|uniref:non-ribosomal peptide synthase/polyketide synthase n=1 Tax=Corallococcus sp. RDP092CA TaxID=3109369 RepID=UPI0035AECB1D